MFHRGFLLLCLVVTSLVATSVVHARELPNLPTLACSGVVHSDGEADQSSGDADQGVPHHHGCHASSAFLPGATDSVRAFAPGLVQPLAMTPAPPARWSVGPDLRPPIA